MKKLMVLFWYLVYAPEFWLRRRRIRKELKDKGYSKKGAVETMRSIERGLEEAIKASRFSRIDMEEL